MKDGLILILADGSWEDDGRLGRLAADSDWTIAADGGFDRAAGRGMKVDEVVGDIDSLTPAGRDRLTASPSAVHVHPRAKDKTDLELAIELALRRAPARIVVYGGLGGRLDHTLANVFLLLKGIPAGVPIELINGAETARLVVDRIELAGGKVGETISLVPLTERAVVRTVGLLYPLDGEELIRGSSRGISNEIASLPASIFVEEGILLLIRRGG